MRRALKPALTLGEIAASLGGSLQGDASQQVERLASLRSADERSISFLVRPQQRDAALASRARRKSCEVASANWRKSSKAKSGVFISLIPMAA